MRLSSGLGALMLAWASTAHAEDGDRAGEGAADCRRIRAEINLTDGTIAGNFGLNGSAAFARDAQGTAPTTAPAESSVFSGLLTISTRRGTLTVRETGMFSSRIDNPEGAVLASWGDSPVGTGAFEGVTGDLFFAGRVVEGLFLVQVSGTLCRP